MGCCESNDNKFTFETYCSKMKIALEAGSLKSVSILIRYSKTKFINYSPPAIDQEIVEINKIKLNPLGFTLFLGNVEMFKHLLNGGASLSEMEKLLEKSELRAINVICYKGHIDLLEFYLPIFLSTYRKKQEIIKSFTIDLKDTLLTRKEYDLAIHSACRANMLQIVNFLFKYFKNEEFCPKEFDIYSKDEAYAEDASLIACRAGSFQLVKMLYEICSMDFKSLNSNNENAIMVCVSGYNSQPSYSYFEILNYLIEVVKLDPTYMYEELLVLADGHVMIKFLENLLEKKGIEVKRNSLPRSYIEVRKRDKGTIEETGHIFTKDVISYLRPEDRSMVSSISICDTQPNGASSTFLSSS